MTAGAVLAGPVLIEEATATTMVLPGQRASIDRFGLVVIEEAR
jgi:N-methylhydantoinase A/oxoprolinase/acetone carboxylase beta subunit